MALPMTPGVRFDQESCGYKSFSVYVIFASAGPIAPSMHAGTLSFSLRLNDYIII